MKRLAAIIVLFVAGIPGTSSRELTASQNPQVRMEGCPAEPVTVPNEPLSPVDSISLRRTTCLGSCPAYTVQIRADGQVTWQGDRFVQIKGPATAVIAPDRARILIETATGNGFWGLCERYTASVTDVPTVITTLSKSGRKKEVSDYYNTAPAWIQALETEIDVLADTHRWIHGDPTMEIFNRAPTWPVSTDLEENPISRLGSDVLRSKPGVTALMKASTRGDIAEIRRQLDGKTDPNAQDSSGWTALMYATQAPNSGAIKTLLEAGANPNIRSFMGQTSLMAFFSSPYQEKLQLLIDAGADVNAQDNNGQTALMFEVYRAIRNNSDARNAEEIEVVSRMRKANARTDVPDANGRTVLDHLAERRKSIRPEEAVVSLQFDRVRQALQ